MVRLSSFDVYPKTLQEFRQRTQTGAIVSLATVGLITLLTCFEFADFVQVKTNEHLFVDTSRGGKQISININITFPALPCSVISLDTLDMSGNHVSEAEQRITKRILNKEGKRMAPSDIPPRSGVPGRHLLFETANSAGHHNHGGHSQPAAAAHGGKVNLANLAHSAGRGDMLLSALLSELLPTVFEDKEAIAELRAHIGVSGRAAWHATLMHNKPDVAEHQRCTEMPCTAKWTPRSVPHPPPVLRVPTSRRSHPNLPWLHRRGATLRVL